MNNDFLEQVKTILEMAYDTTENDNLMDQYYNLVKKINYIIAMNMLEGKHEMIRADGNWSQNESLRQDIIEFVKECYESSNK